jgi:hypothetical protein
MTQIVYRFGRRLAAGAATLAIGGCITNQQLADFGRVEFARIIADSIGRYITILAEAAGVTG